MSEIHSREWRVEFDRDAWRNIKPEFSDWIQKRGTGYRDITVYYWDGMAMKHADAHSMLEAEKDTYRATVEEERLSLLAEMDTFITVNTFLIIPDELTARAYEYGKRREACLHAIDQRLTKRFFICFNNREDAMLFKLTFGGDQ